VRNKILVFLFFAFILATIGTVRMRSKSTQERLSELQASPERGSLNWYAQRATIKGERSAVVYSPIPIYAVVTGLDEALSNFFVIRARPVAMRSHVKDSESIWTWYKFRIIENLSKGSLPNSSNFPGAPEDLLPRNADEVLFDFEGGSLVLDGVSLVQRPHGMGLFLASQEYILFLAPDPTGNGFTIPLGPSGVLLVHPDGFLESASRQADDALTKDIGNSLLRFRSALEQRKNRR
jgi:hypothetical protein